MNMPAAETGLNSSYSRAYKILDQVARDRSCVYRWLAIGFYPPDPLLVDALHTGQMEHEIRAATTWLGRDQAQLLDYTEHLKTWTAIRLAELRQEYLSLFEKSPISISLHESEYRWRDTFNLSATSDILLRSLQQQYQRDGLVPIAGMEDHVAVELEFMAYQCESEAACWTSLEAKAARELRRQERAFLDDDLGRWLPELCLRIQERDRSSFYQILAGLCDCWLGLDQGPGYLSMAAQI